MPASSSPLLRWVVLPAWGFSSELMARVPLLRSPGPKTLIGPQGVGRMEMNVLHAIHDGGPRLVEMPAEGELALRLEIPGIKVIPVSYFHPARAVREAVRQPPRLTAEGIAAEVRVTLRLRRRGDASPVGGATVAAFTNFRRREGVEAVSRPDGIVQLALPDGIRLDRLYVFAPRDCWGFLARPYELREGAVIEIDPIRFDGTDLLSRLYAGLPPEAGRGVTVGIVDTGIARSHPGLGNLAGGANLVYEEIAEDRGRTDDFGPAETDGAHGTHVAGIVAAGATAGVPFRGVAPGARLRSYRVFPHHPPGSGQSATNYDIMNAIDRAVADGCDIVNLSLGGGPQDDGIRAAIGNALARGTLIVAAAGNDGRRPVSYPAALPNTVAVSAMGAKGSFPDHSSESGDVAAPYAGAGRELFMAAFSNYGPQIDLTGPGVGIVSTVPDDGYGVMSGTSMATPAISGFTAYLLSETRDILEAPRDAARSRGILELLYEAAAIQGFGRDYEGFGLPLPRLAGPGV
jgi:subtilisin